MKYIKSMEITNFQSHKNTNINFEEGLNVICGPSDSGKSAIIRALKWVLYNEPKGTDYIRQGESLCRVSILLSDNTTIIRERNKAKNAYRLIDSFGNENVFEGFGNDIPREILSAHGINRIYIDSESPQSINLASQLEGPFLIGETGSVKAKAVGKLVGVHIIDEALKLLNKDMLCLQSEERKLSSDYEVVNENLKQYEKLELVRQNIEIKEVLLNSIKAKYILLEKLMAIKTQLGIIDNEITETRTVIESIGNMESAFTSAEELGRMITMNSKRMNLRDKYKQVCSEIDYQSKILEGTKHIDECTLLLLYADNLSIRLSNLYGYRDRYKVYSEEIKNLEYICSSLSSIDRAKKGCEDSDSMLTLLKRLEDIKSRLNSVNSSLNTGNKYISKLKNVDNAEYISKLADTVLEKYNGMISLRLNMIKIKEEIASANRDIENEDKNIKMCLEEYTDLLKQLGRCPVCFSPIEEHTIEKIINEL